MCVRARVRALASAFVCVLSTGASRRRLRARAGGTPVNEGGREGEMEGGGRGRESGDMRVSDRGSEGDGEGEGD